MSHDDRMGVALGLVGYLPEEGWFRHNPRGIHGVAHVTRVLVWAATIADLIGRPDAIRRGELLWAAATHDVGRIDDGIDAGHGERSAAWVRAHLLSERPAVAEVDLDLVADLCTWHLVPDGGIGRLSLELLILKDADGLDRVRLGDLDPNRLRLQVSRRLVPSAERLERATRPHHEQTADRVLATAISLGH